MFKKRKKENIEERKKIILWLVAAAFISGMVLLWQYSWRINFPQKISSGPSPQWQTIQQDINQAMAGLQENWSEIKQKTETTVEERKELEKKLETLKEKVLREVEK